MEMKVSTDILKSERTKRAWSQEHLAQVTGLGLRTIQRIETTGMASNESIAAIATAFDTTVAELVAERPGLQTQISKSMFQKARLWVAIAAVLLAQLFSPPELSFALVCTWLWVVFEAYSAVTETRTRTRQSF